MTTLKSIFMGVSVCYFGPLSSSFDARTLLSVNLLICCGEKLKLVISAASDCSRGKNQTPFPIFQKIFRAIDHKNDVFPLYPHNGAAAFPAWHLFRGNITLARPVLEVTE